jgi:hypothetical protein
MEHQPKLFQPQSARVVVADVGKLELVARGIEARRVAPLQRQHACVHRLARVQVGQDTEEDVPVEFVDPVSRGGVVRHWGHGRLLAASRRVRRGFEVARHFVEQLVLEQSCSMEKGRITVGEP